MALPAVRRLEDKPGWTNRMEIKSGTSSRLYIVAEQVIKGVPTGRWGCSCMGWKRTRNCKHLTEMHLPSIGRTAIGAARTPARADTRASFSDAAYAHYDTSDGYGSADQWLAAAEAMAEGRGFYVPPARGSARATPDMARLGLTEMPGHVKGLVSAMRARSRELHPDIVHPTDPDHRQKFPQCPQCAAAVEAFTAMQRAYERLLRRYPK